MEDLYCVDSNSGEVVTKQVHSLKPNEVTYNEKMNKIILSYDEKVLISIYNHGTNIPPTGSDFVSCGYRRYKFGLVVCHNGEVYYYRSGSVRFLKEFLDKRIEKYKEKRYNLSEYEAHIKTLKDFKDEFDIDWRKL